MDDIRWVEIDSWHLIANTELNAAGIPTVTTRCGITRPWDQTFLDRLPGGDEKSCENCLVLLAGDVDTSPKVDSPKKATKKK